MNVLFIVDGSLSNPILFSQGFPHMNENHEKGIKYSILSFENPNKLKNDLLARKRFEEAKKETQQFANIYTISLGLEETVLQRKLRFVLLLIYTILKGTYIVIKEGTTIIHGRSNFPTLAALMIKKITKVKVLFDNRGLVSDEIKKENIFRITLERRIEKYLLKNANSIVVVSNAFKNYLNSKYDTEIIKKIIVIENSFSTKRFIYSEKLRSDSRKKFNLTDKLVMIYSGPSVSWQRFDLVLKAFKELKKIKSNAYLMVISYDAEMEKIILNSGICKTDFSVYNLLANEVNKYLTVADFGVIFRDNRIRSKICAPIKFAEYLASGLPILLMNNIGDTEKIIKENKVGIVIHDDEKNINIGINQILELIKDTAIKQKCRQIAEKYLSLEIAAAKYYHTYKGLNE